MFEHFQNHITANRVTYQNEGGVAGDKVLYESKLVLYLILQGENAGRGS